MPGTDSDRLEHVKMIQAVISRMAQNSFVLKGWSVTLGTGILGVAISEKQAVFAWLGFLPALAFWGLDAFYLRQEKLFRALHDDVCAAFGSNAPVTFAMNTATLETPPSWLRVPLHAHGTRSSRAAALGHPDRGAVGPSRVVGNDHWLHRDGIQREVKQKWLAEYFSPSITTVTSSVRIR